MKKGLIGWILGLISVGVLFFVIGYSWKKGAQAGE